MVGPYVGEVTDHAGSFVDCDVAIFWNGLVVTGFELRAGPVGDLGQVHDARVGEGRADGEVGVGVDLGRARGAELRQRQQRTAWNREEHRVSAAVVCRTDAVAPVGVLIIGREGNLWLGVQSALGEYPANRRVRLAVVAEEVGLLRSDA